ncbi:MAG TPA: ribonuclease H-like domain-containing protein [Candidatus Limnocylindria bacterium]
MNDLRARIAQIVERDRAQHERVSGENGGTGRNPLYATVDPPASGRDPVARGPSAGAAVPTVRYEVREQRFAVDDLGLEIVGRGACDALLLAHLGLKGDAPRNWQDVLFLDVETTGLSGGTGTYIFLIGVAHFNEKELVLRQHMLLDLGAEREFIEGLKKEIEPFRACASYNGKAFDLPIIRTRFVMAIRSELTVDDSHLDLLHPARRLWRDRFGSTTLKQLEESVLDEGRIADIPGWLIPDAYFHYLRKRDPAIIAPVLEHNARDVISLVRITDRVARAVLAARAGRAPDHAPAAFALARVFERTGEIDAAFACYESAYYDGDNALRAKLALAYARHLERRGNLERALGMMETLVGLGLGTERWREQAESRIRRLSKKRWRQLATAS